MQLFFTTVFYYFIPSTLRLQAWKGINSSHVLVFLSNYYSFYCRVVVVEHFLFTAFVLDYLCEFPVIFVLITTVVFIVVVAHCNFVSKHTHTWKKKKKIFLLMKCLRFIYCRILVALETWNCDVKLDVHIRNYIYR